MPSLLSISKHHSTRRRNASGPTGLWLLLSEAVHTERQQSLFDYLVESGCEQRPACDLRGLSPLLRDTPTSSRCEHRHLLEIPFLEFSRSFTRHPHCKALFPVLLRLSVGRPVPPPAGLVKDGTLTKQEPRPAFTGRGSLTLAMSYSRAT